MHKHPAEIFGLEHSGINQREQCDWHSSKISGEESKFHGKNFWARGYFVSTVGLDEDMVRAYIREQEKEDERYDQLKLSV